ncbi:hypothetical protein RRF57_005210 [Xylaria bambusicola]|uniref:Uncharacterized protein n=1 Tax=Xylaria bambusicola TaxID=326684 RepID=A0AAN7YXK8_9PEZI
MYTTFTYTANANANTIGNFSTRYRVANYDLAGRLSTHLCREDGIVSRHNAVGSSLASNLFKLIML